jgi:hypothetical protein
MGKLGGTWIDVDGRTPEGLHRCRTPLLLPFTRTGAVWECGTCGERWRVERDLSGLAAGEANARMWQRLGQPLTRQDVADQLQLMVSTRPEINDMTIGLALDLLEELGLASWTPGSVSRPVTGSDHGRMDR